MPTFRPNETVSHADTAKRDAADKLLKVRDETEDLISFGDADESAETDLLRPGETRDAAWNPRSAASDVSWDIFQELALIDEGLRGINETPRPTASQPLIADASNVEDMASSAVRRINTKSSSEEITIAYVQQSANRAHRLDDRPEEEHDSLLVNRSARDSAYTVTPIDETRQALTGQILDINIPVRSEDRYTASEEVVPSLQRPTLYPVSSSPRFHPYPIARGETLDQDAPLTIAAPLPRRPFSQSPPPISLVQHHPDRLAAPGPSQQRAARRGTESRSQSRHRSTGGTSSISSGVKCDDCEDVGPHRSYCNVCQMIFCQSCWERVAPHRRRGGPANAVPHERTDYAVAKKVQRALAPDLPEDVRERLHDNDIATTWFGVFREKGELPLFREYGRYAGLISQLKTTRADLSQLASMSLHSDQQDEVMYPSLASFVGETGAGKSTLIKLLIDLSSFEGENPQTPVIGAVGRDIATSEDVHLYLDPESSRVGVRESPILYADCEGLSGGGRDPVGAKWRQKFERSLRKENIPEGGMNVTLLKHVSQRPLVWANSERTQSREFAVAHLYPRLLYTFSDVIIFVLKNPRVIESVLERLLSWAEAAVERSSNQPILPRAIIVLNASENNIEEELWDVDRATTKLMESLSGAIRNHDFKKYIDIWKQRGRLIETVEDLVWSYYASVRVVRVPTTGRPNLVQQQVQKLSAEIRGASVMAQERKRELRMLLDADGLEPYLQFAIDHFAYSLDTPFDFVQASFTYSPIPMNFGGNILKLAVRVMECWKDRAKASTIFEELSYVVASCIMFDAARNKIKGTPEQIFPRFLEHIDNALENFCDRYWPCEYTGPKGGRCVNVRSGHQKGHQLKNGKLLSAGEYQSDFSFQNHQYDFEHDVYWKLAELTQIVQTRAKTGLAEVQAAVQVHKEILPPFFHHASRHQPGAFASHTVCFSCLKEAPEHALPCGHIICTPCLMTFGTKRQHSVDINECPLEPREQPFRPAWTVQLKPENCGIRILSLDGGGVRGFVELEIMAELERRLGSNLDIRSFFDLIVGTSTSGVIALGLTACDWNLQECTEQFRMFCDKAFTEQKGSYIPGFRKVVELCNHSKYDERPLVEYLQEAFARDHYLFGGQRGHPGRPGIKVAVTAMTSANNPVVFANYNRLCEERLPYHFQRSETLQEELKTWEVARAISATPKYIKPFSHDASHQVFSDGSLQTCNHIRVAYYERNLIWPDLRNEFPDLSVSIGTAFDGQAKGKRTGKLMRPTRTKKPYDGALPRRLIKQGNTDPSDTENVALREYIGQHPSDEDIERFVRINYRLSNSLPKFDDVGEIPRLQREIRHLTQDDPKIRELAKRLVASCFYLDVDGEVQEILFGDSELYEIRGHFRCRLTSKKDVAGLGIFIRRYADAGHDPYFIVKNELDANYIIQNEESQHEKAQEVHLTSSIIKRMETDGLFRMDRPLLVRSQTKAVCTRIALCYTRDTSFPISRFPRCLFADRPTALARQHAMTSRSSARWAGRPRSHIRRMKEWMPRDAKEAIGKGDIIERYCDANHLLGRASGLISMDTSMDEDDGWVLYPLSGLPTNNSPDHRPSRNRDDGSPQLSRNPEHIQEYYAPSNKARIAAGQVEIQDATQPEMELASHDGAHSYRTQGTRLPMATPMYELMSHPIHELSGTPVDAKPSKEPQMIRHELDITRNLPNEYDSF